MKGELVLNGSTRNKRDEREWLSEIRQDWWPKGTRKDGIDYDEVFALVARIEAIRFQMSSMGELTFFLGLQVKQKSRNLHISGQLDESAGFAEIVDFLRGSNLSSISTSSSTIQTTTSYHQNKLHHQIPTPIPASTPTPIPDADPEPMEHTFEEPSPAHQHFSLLQEHDQGQMTLDDLLQVVPQLLIKIDSLEKDLKQTKLTMGSAIVKLVKKVKKMEVGCVCFRPKRKESEAQGRKSQDDPLVSLVQRLVTPSKTTVNTSGEEKVEDISPTNIRRKLKTSPWKVVTSLDFQKEVSTGAEGVNTAEGINTGSIKVSTVSGQVSTDSINKSIPSPDKGQREGKALMIIEESPKKTKEQIQQEEASLAEAIRLDTLEKEEEAKQVHLDSLLAQRIAEEEELNEQQKQRRAQVQFEAQHYTDEDWDLIRAKIEANAELSKKSGDMEAISAEEFKFLKENGKKKQEFDKLVKQVESFAPINFEATKDSLKRFGEELQTKTSKRLKSDEAKDDESTKKTGKRRKQIARKGLHFEKTDEDESEASKDTDPISGTNIPINPIPVAMKPPSIATYKIIKQGEKGVYQIVREDGTDIIYGMNGPEDKLEKVLWEYLKNMFEEPVSTNPIWSLLGAKGLTSPEQMATGKGISNPFMAIMVCQKPSGNQLNHVSRTEELKWF
ncbi:hypothetical protein Tco_1235645 [Tanacetum coccineum]